MLKISGNRLSEYNKSCRIFYSESNKIGFAFFCFFYDFIWILQKLAKHIYYLSYSFSLRPWNFLQIHNYALTSHKTPRNKLRTCNVALGPVAGAGGAIPARPAALAGQEWARGGLGAP
jgi:hypothetical protein